VARISQGVWHGCCACTRVVGANRGDWLATTGREGWVSHRIGACIATGGISRKSCFIVFVGQVYFDGAEIAVVLSLSDKKDRVLPESRAAQSEAEICQNTQAREGAAFYFGWKRGSMQAPAGKPDRSKHYLATFTEIGKMNDRAID